MMAFSRCKDKTKIIIIFPDTIYACLWTSLRIAIRKKIIVLKKALTGGAPFCGVGPLAVFGRWVSSRFLSAASESLFKFTIVSNISKTKCRK